MSLPTRPRGSLIHRFSTERDANVGASSVDAWGHPLPPSWEAHLDTVACRAWTDTGRGVGSSVGSERVTDTEVVEIQNRRMIVALGTDILETDRVTSITNAAGDELFDGPMNVEAILVYAEHLEVSLRRVR